MPAGKWDTKRPIKVIFLRDSFNHYARTKRLANIGKMRAAAIADVKTVIDVYNAVEGSTLRLVYADDVSGDNDLDAPEKDVFDKHAIVVGFSDGKHPASESAEAWMWSNRDDVCKFTRRHIAFRKAETWTFGPPDPTDEDGRNFGGGMSFLGILTHEMGHALGFAHSVDKYSVTAKSFRTWTRGPGGKMRPELLPDDIKGMLALYGPGGDPAYFDVQVTNTWCKSAADSIQRSINPSAYQNQQTEIANLQAAISVTEQTLPALKPKARREKEQWIENKEVELSLLEVDLLNCRIAQNAIQSETNAFQIPLCRVSSRADQWVDPLDGAELCGVNAPGSRYATVSREICPDDQVMVRFTLNNRSIFQNARIEIEAWFSPDGDLDNGGRGDLKSPDVRVFDLRAGTSALIGQVYRLPPAAVPGRSYWVIVRAVPYSERGESLWRREADRWNNAILVPSSITVSTSASC